jgi:hypothetical protein
MDQKRLRERDLEGLQAQKQRIELEIRALTKAVGTFAFTITGGQALEKKRKRRTAAQRKAQAARMKAYWATRRGEDRSKITGKSKRSPKTPKKSAKLSTPAVT